MVSISGRTTFATEKWGGGGAYYGALGGWNTEKRTAISAAILDMNEGHLVKSIDVSAEGEGASGVIGFVPYVFLPPATEAISCEALANRIIVFLNSARSVPARHRR